MGEDWLDELDRLEKEASEITHSILEFGESFTPLCEECDTETEAECVNVVSTDKYQTVYAQFAGMKRFVDPNVRLYKALRNHARELIDAAKLLRELAERNRGVSPPKQVTLGWKPKAESG